MVTWVDWEAVSGVWRRRGGREGKGRQLLCGWPVCLANDGNKTGLAASPGLTALAIARHSASLL